MAYVTVYGPKLFTLSGMFGDPFAYFIPSTYSNEGTNHFTITASNGNVFDVYSSAADFTYDSGIPNSGTITEIDVTTAGPNPDYAYLQGFSLTFDQLQSAIGNSSGLFSAISNGDDSVNFTSTSFDPSNKVDTGAGYDTVSISGTTTSTIVLNDTSLQNVELLYLGTPNPNLKPGSFSITMADGNVAAGQTLTVFDELSHKDTLTLNAGFETNGSYDVYGSDGTDNIFTGAGDDVIVTGGDLEVSGRYQGVDAIMSGGGNDAIYVVDSRVTVQAGTGSDKIAIGSYYETRNLQATDQIDGGTDPGGDHEVTGDGKSIDVLDFQSGAAQAKFNATTVTNVETFKFHDGAYGGKYQITTDDATVGAMDLLTVDASALFASTIAFNGSAETDGTFHFLGGHSGTSQIESFIGGAQNDTFDFAGTQASQATLAGGAGNDTFNFTFAGFLYNVKASGAHVAVDTVDGGAGSDVVNISGDYTTQLQLQANTFQHVETVNLAAGCNYNFLLADGTGSSPSFDSHLQSAMNYTVLDGSVVTQMALNFNTGSGNDVLVGGALSDVIVSGAGSDVIDITKGGNDSVHANSGNDVVFAGNALTNGDNVDGRTDADLSDFDELSITGNYGSLPAPFVFSAGTMAAFELLQLTRGSQAVPFGYYLVLNDSSVASAAHQNLTIDGSTLLKNDIMNIDGSHVHSGTLTLVGGLGPDFLVGGTGDDLIMAGNGSNDLTGGAGSDRLLGGTGIDLFIYNAIGDSTAKQASNNFDHIVGFDLGIDRLHFANLTVTAVDNMVIGSTAPGATSIANALSADLHTLGAGHAVLYVGTDSHLYIVVNADGTTGFQANHDYVIDLTGAGHATTTGTGGLTLADFQ